VLVLGAVGGISRFHVRRRAGTDGRAGSLEVQFGYVSLDERRGKATIRHGEQLGLADLSSQY